ncbi:beta-ketoacyl-ACP synthase 3 [Streptomyces sp. NPDC059003]|uniref:beta-ketoacyl-ACP synthase 3 n=1 Tax=Streptomyces sp. NPDC059003 TaxID=3346691 RepID=UPI00369CF9F9
MPQSAVLAGLGACVPPTLVDNTEIAARLGVTPEWIQHRTGVRTRHVLACGERNLTLAVQAGRRALESAGVTQADAVIVASWTHDQVCPPTAPAVASALGLVGCAAFDVGATCAGFLYGLATASGLMATGCAQRVLVIAVETHTPFIDANDPVTAPLFADGAGAAVVHAGAVADEGAIGPFDLGSDGAGRDHLGVAAEGQPGRADANWYLRMDGSAVFLHAVRRMTASSQAVLTACGWTTAGVDALVAHQANARILDAVAGRLAVPPQRAVNTIAHFGNTGCASIPLALATASCTGVIGPGDRLLLTAFGAGFTWASTVLVWPDLAVCAPCNDLDAYQSETTLPSRHKDRSSHGHRGKSV